MKNSEKLYTNSFGIRIESTFEQPLNSSADYTQCP